MTVRAIFASRTCTGGAIVKYGPNSIKTGNVFAAAIG